MAALRKSLVLADPNRCWERELPMLTAFRYERTVVGRARCACFAALRASTLRLGPGRLPDQWL
ncbi:hypothetical protein GCM10009827_019510 [Dactylosporangium maewongense]|uniref:Uncharacterized protein n=1 Tax=Dactylosporangium maewongense TaxID=634393 RepID=A0ABN1ZWA2_9ACTN